MNRFFETLSLREKPMKIALWIVISLIAALWTGTVAVFAELTHWLATTVASDQPRDMINNVGQWPMPAWSSFWVDPTWIQSLQGPWVEVMSWLGQSGQALGDVVTWLIPLIWVVWGGGMLVLVVSALAGHFLIGKFSRWVGLNRNPATVYFHTTPEG